MHILTRIKRPLRRYFPQLVTIVREMRETFGGYNSFIEVQLNGQPLTIVPNMTKRVFAQALARCFLKVDRPEKQYSSTGGPHITEHIFKSEDELEQVERVEWLDENEIRFHTNHQPVVHLKISHMNFDWLERAYEAIETEKWQEFEGKHWLNLTVLRCWK